MKQTKMIEEDGSKDKYAVKEDEAQLEKYKIPYQCSRRHNVTMQ